MIIYAPPHRWIFRDLCNCRILSDTLFIAYAYMFCLFKSLWWILFPHIYRSVFSIYVWHSCLRFANTPKTARTRKNKNTAKFCDFPFVFLALLLCKSGGFYSNSRMGRISINFWGNLISLWVCGVGIQTNS